MNFVLTFSIVISLILQTIVSLRIYLTGQNNHSYMLFFGISIVTLCWALLNYFSVILVDSRYLTYIVRSILFFAVLQISLFYFFAHIFPHGRLNFRNKSIICYFILTISTACMTLSPYVFSSVSVVHSVINTRTQWGIIVFIFYTCVSIFLAFKSLLKKFIYSVGIQRKQLLIILIAACLNWILIPITNFALTLILGSLFFAMISPVYSLFFSSIIAYALSRYNLFDVKKILRNSTIYVSYYLRKCDKQMSLKYYEFQTLVYKSGSDHIALDFSSVKNLDDKSIKMFTILRRYMGDQGIKVYFINYSKRVFDQLKAVTK